MGELRITVVGLGSIGRRHVRLLKEMEDICVSVVDTVEANIERTISELGKMHTYHKLEDALKDQPDIVMIATPHGMHSAQTIQCLEAGCNVFCEKPMSDCLEGAAAMLDASRRYNKTVGVAYMFHFHPAVRRVKAYIENNKFGNVLHFSSNMGTYLTLMRSVSRHQMNTLGAIFMDNIHDIDLMYWLLGKLPKTVKVSGIKAGQLELTSDPNLCDVQMTFGDSMLANIHFDYIQYPQVHTNHIVGDRGWGDIDFQTSCLRYGELGGEVTEEKFDFMIDDMYRDEWRDFINAVINGCKPSSPLESAIIPTILTEAMVKSYLEKRTVLIEELLHK